MPHSSPLKSTLLKTGLIWIASHSAFAQTATTINWTRTSDGDWSLNTNWSGSPTLVNNGFYRISLGANPSNDLSLNNDLTGLTLTRLAIEGPTITTAYEIHGNAATLTGNIVNRGTKPLTVNLDLTLLNTVSDSGNDARLRFHSGDVGANESIIYLNGVLSGNSDSYAFLSGAREIVYGGTQPNTFTGTTVMSGGILVLQKPDGVNAISGPLEIRVGAPVRLAASNQIDDSVTVTFYEANSRLQLSGFNETLGNIVSMASNSGIIENRSATPGTLTLSNNSTNIVFNGLLQNGEGGGALNLIKNGTNSLTLNGNSTYQGTTTVSQGTLIVGHANALGSGGSVASGTTVAAGARVVVKSGITVTNEIIEINGSGSGDNSGALKSDNVSGTTSTWNGEVHLGPATGSGADPSTQAARIGASNSALRIGGKITDNGLNRDLAIRTSSDGQKVILANSNNSYRATYVVIGDLLLGVNNGLPQNSELYLGNNSGFGRVTLDLNGYNQSLPKIATIGLDGVTRVITNSSLTTTSTLTWRVASGVTQTFGSADLTKTSITGNLNLTKSDAGTLELGGVNSFTGLTTVSAGSLVVSNAQALGANGTSDNGTTVLNNAHLALKGNITLSNEVIRIAGNGGSGGYGALRTTGLTTEKGVWAGEILLADHIGGDPHTGAPRIGSNGPTLEISGRINDEGLGRDLAIRSNQSSHKVIISGTNNNYRNTYLVIGELQLGANNALSTGSLTLGNSSNSGTEVFDLKGFNQELAGLHTLGNSSAIKRITNTGATTSTLTLNTPTGLTYSFNTDSYTNSYLTGNLNLVKQGAGTQQFGGLLSHTGKTDIQAGTLALFGEDSDTTTAGHISQSSEIAIHDGAVLDLLGLTSQTLTSSAITVISGHGEVRGNLNVQGTLAPGSLDEAAGKLTVSGNLSTGSDALLKWDLSNPASLENDKVELTGDLSLQGTLQIQAQVGFGVGTYTLIQYGGSQSHDITVLNTPVAYTATLDDSAPNQIRLRVKLASGWQIWDGPASDATTIEGGSGIWNNDPSHTNWTDSASDYQSAWDAEGEHGAIFRGQGGDVTIASGETIKAKGLVFEVDGYHILPGNSSSGLELQPNSVVEVFGGATATISAPISGDLLVKSQGGTLVLRAQNTHYETLIEDGTLEVGEGGSLGLGPVTNHATLAFSPDTAIRVEPVISGSGDVIQRGSGTTVLVADHSYTGSTIIESGTLQLGDGGTTGSLSSPTIQNDGTLAIDRSYSLILTQAISGSGSLSQRGNGIVILQGDLSFTGNTEVQSSSLRFESDTSKLGGNLIVDSQVEFAQPSDSSFKNTISGSGDVIQSGTARLDLTQANLQHQGKTIVNSGTLAAASMPKAILQLHSGSVFQTAGTAVGSVKVKQLQLLGGKLQWDLSGKDSDLLISELPALLESATTVEFTATPTVDGIYRLIENVDSNWNLSLLNATQYGSEVTPSFFLNGSDLYFTATRSSSEDWVSGSKLQNSSPISVPTTSGFRVIGKVSTGSPSENNVIRELSFADDSELTVHNTLTITNGNFTVAEGDAIVRGDRLQTPDDFKKLGLGTLTLRNNHTDIAGSLEVNEGELELTRSVDMGDELQLSPNATLFVRGTSYVKSAGKAKLAGTTQLDGTLKSPKVQIAPSGNLSGSGKILGHLQNNGVVEPGSPLGTLTVDGDFTQENSGILRMDIAGKKQHDQLKVTGTSRLGGTLEVSSRGSHALQLGDRYTLIESGKLKGQFGKILFADNQPFRARFLLEKGEGTLLIAPQSYQSLAQTTAQRRIAKSLDSWLEVSDEEKEEVTRALDSLRAKEYPQAFESMQPHFQASAMEIGREMSHQHHQMLHQQLSTRRLGQRMAAVQALGEGDGEERRLGARGGAKFGLKESVMPYQDHQDRWDVWVQSGGVFSSGGMSLTPGEDWESGTLMIGADYAITEHFGIGIFASYQGGRGDFDNGGDIDLESSRVGIYATYDRGGFYLNGSFSLGQTQFDIKRPIRFGSYSKNAYSEPDGWEWSAMLGGGYDIQAGKWTFGPQFSVVYQELHLGAYDEHGASALNLRVNDTRLESLRSYIGGRIAYTLQVNEKLTFFPEVRAFWQHEYLGGVELRSRFNNNTGPEWVYTSGDQNPDAVFIGAGFSWMYGSNFGGNLFYHATFGRNDDISHTFSLTGNWRF